MFKNKIHEFIGKVQIKSGDLEINTHNVITNVGLQEIINSVKGVSTKVTKIAFGNGTNLADESDVSLTNPIFFPIREWYFDSNEHKAVFSYLIPSVSNIDGNQYTEMGLFDATETKMFSRVLLQNSITKQANLQLSGTWEYSLKEGEKVLPFHKVVIEPFRGAYINNSHKDGYYPSKEIIQEPEWYNLQSMKVRKYYDVYSGSEVTFPLEVKSDMLIVPDFDESNETEFKYIPIFTNVTVKDEISGLAGWKYRLNHNKTSGVVSSDFKNVAHERQINYYPNYVKGSFNNSPKLQKLTNNDGVGNLDVAENEKRIGYFGDSVIVNFFR